jgi:hypothetical protein
MASEVIRDGFRDRQRLAVARASRCFRSIIGRDVAALDPDAIFTELSLPLETDAGSLAPRRLTMAARGAP